MRRNKSPSSSEQQVDAVGGDCQRRHRREHKFLAIAAHVMRFLIRKQSANADKAAAAATISSAR
jgi:hypothetical protein